MCIRDRVYTYLPYDDKMYENMPSWSKGFIGFMGNLNKTCLLYTSRIPRRLLQNRKIRVIRFLQMCIRDRYATYTLPEFIAEVTVSGKTSDSSFENLLPEGTYYAFAVCVANDGTCISEATVETIRTSESPKNSYTVSSEVVTDRCV